MSAGAASSRRPEAERPEAELPEPELAAAVALSGLEGMTPLRLRLLLRRHRPTVALAVALGHHHDAQFDEHLDRHGPTGAGEWRRRWVEALARCDVATRYARFCRAGVGVTVMGSADFPACLADDPEAPVVLYYQGDLAALDGRRVGIVGTRSATATGRRVATDLGLGLSTRGVRVVSGLARGIDACAHRGALAGTAPPVGVVACGLDVVYPPEHRLLFADVAAAGVLLSERPPGTPPRATAFPERNRILAAMSEVLVVVESRAAGGSMITTREAAKRDIPLMAVPGSLASRASEGPNHLLRDGVAAVALDAADVLVALGLDTRRSDRRRFDPRPVPERADREVLDVLGGDTLTLEEVALRGNGDLVATALALGRLEAAGWVSRSGGWFEVLPVGVA